MIPTQFGDLSRHMSGMRHTSRLKSELSLLTEELSSGLKSDLPKSLGLQRERAAELDQRLKRVDTYLSNVTQVSTRYGVMQTALEQVSNSAQHTSEQLMINPDIMSLSERAMASKIAGSSFDAMVDALSATSGGIALFSGDRTDTQPLPSAKAILNSLKSSVDLTLDASVILTQVENFFESDTGPFVAAHYQGSNSSSGTLIGDNQKISHDVTAISKPIRQMLAGAALAALISEPDVAAHPNKQRDLIIAARDKMADRGELTLLRGHLGAQEQRVQETRSKLTAERTASLIEINDLQSADSFETATRLQQVQLQLETHFTLAGRLSRLSLVNYLP